MKRASAARSEPHGLSVHLQGSEGEGLVRVGPRPKLWDIIIGRLTLGAFGAHCAEAAPWRVQVLVVGKVTLPAEDRPTDMVLA